MAEKYFINTSPRINGIHTVHRQGCPFLPEPERRILLGVFQSSRVAVKEGRMYFRRADGCPFCSKEHNEMKRLVLTAGEVKPYIISSSHLKATWESQMLCSLS
jgi:hypothetical protein